ncbi:hypothetical protein G5B88_07875 [Herbaspirillum seropedicae]|uniref:hypothetical protein n=1 Tax=Herbaspirillum seropedicae TaxID=964 RepID=UPI000B1945EC|nr:hypothetical protein [Herbaspirillum seropedicae]UMU21097.1 hypothetical protein G5B88_07875 [Herbaspirillum seropedicae]
MIKPPFHPPAGADGADRCAWRGAALEAGAQPRRPRLLLDKDNPSCAQMALALSSTWGTQPLALRYSKNAHGKWARQH